MSRLPVVPFTACLLAAAALAAGADAPRNSRYEDLVALFGEWRSFQKPKRVDGVPDYTAGAMTAQQQMDAGIRMIPKLLEQAKGNLIGNARDLWTFGAKSIRQQSADLAQLASRLTDAPGDLEADVRRAQAATDALAAWLDSQAASRTGPSGVGVENYDWYLKNVQLAPYTWHEEVTIMEREPARALAFHWIFDRSELTSWQWLRTLGPAPARGVHISAGLEATPLASRSG